MCKCRFSAEKFFVGCTAFLVKMFDLATRQKKLKMGLHWALRSNQGNYYLHWHTWSNSSTCSHLKPKVVCPFS